MLKNKNKKETDDQYNLRVLLKLEKSTPDVSYSRNVKLSTNWVLPDGKQHRDFGPAFSDNQGSNFLYQYGKLHREDGPAVHFDDDVNGLFQQYWIDGKELTKEEFEQWKLKSKKS